MENWKTINAYPNYEVSDKGRIRSLNWHMTGEVRVLSPRLNHKGYLQLWLYDSGHRKMFSVHRLVAEAFIPNPHELPQINHKDRNRANNSVDNLEWCDSLYNVTYSQGKGVLQIDVNTGRVLSEFISLSEAARNTGTKVQNISNVCHGKKTTAGGFKWRFS